MKLAVSGDPGSFSEEAGRIYAGREGIEPELVFATDMRGVLRAVNAGEVEQGIFPVVNSRGGLVYPAFEAMGEFSFQMIGELWMEVHQCLMVLPGTDKGSITEIASHSQALAQCDRYLKTHFPDVALTEWQDTAKAASDLRDGVLSPTTAVIAPARSAQIYGLEVIGKGIQDQRPNLTTFIIVTAR
jgi:prephenate dehydratase